jgi:hypothetical protein
LAKDQGVLHKEKDLSRIAKKTGLALPKIPTKTHPNKTGKTFEEQWRKDLVKDTDSEKLLERPLKDAKSKLVKDKLENPSKERLLNTD